MFPTKRLWNTPQRNTESTSNAHSAMSSVTICSRSSLSRILLKRTISLLIPFRSEGVSLPAGFYCQSLIIIRTKRLRHLYIIRIRKINNTSFIRIIQEILIYPCISAPDYICSMERNGAVLHLYKQLN